MLASFFTRIAILAACIALPTAALAEKHDHDHKAPAAKADKAAHTHEHHAPHDGTLIALGEEFAHVELVLDPATGKVKVYALDGEAEKPVRLAEKELKFELLLPGKDGKDSTATLTVKAIANALTGETVGETSEFEGSSDALKGQQKFSGKLSVIRIRGKEFKDVAFKFPEGNE